MRSPPKATGRVKPLENPSLRYGMNLPQSQEVLHPKFPRIRERDTFHCTILLRNEREEKSKYAQNGAEVMETPKRNELHASRDLPHLPEQARERRRYPQDPRTANDVNSISRVRCNVVEWLYPSCLLTRKASSFPAPRVLLQCNKLP
jgi:hypothetical protein